MLPGVTVPPCLLSVLEAVRGVFTAPTFATFASLVTGLLGATGSRTVTGMWTAAGLAGRAHHARAHRFFSHARWDLDALGLRVARVVVARFVSAGAALTVVVDDTLFHRCGARTRGVFWQHDGSAKGRDGIGRGNCFVVVGLIVTVPFLTRPICLPVLFRLHIPKSGVSKPDAARALVGLLARAFPERRVHVVADSAYRGPAWRTLPGNTTFTTRLASNAVLYALPLAPTGRRGHVEQTIKDSKILIGAGNAANRLQRAVERTVPFTMLGLTILVLWYTEHATADTDLAAARARAPWNRKKTHVSVNDMLIAFRRARITPNAASQATPDQYPTPPATSSSAAA